MRRTVLDIFELDTFGLTTKSRFRQDVETQKSDVKIL